MRFFTFGAWLRWHEMMMATITTDVAKCEPNWPLSSVCSSGVRVMRGRTRFRSG